MCKAPVRDNRRMPVLPAPPRPALLWDVFCRVIDNFGDIGVGWRLCRQLAARGHTVRLWVDDASALDWMAPGAVQGEHSGITVLPWERSQDTDFLATQPPAQVWVETFGCEVAPEFIAAYAHSMRDRGQIGIQFPAWINLEYLSAEDFARRCHGLASPVMSGAARSATKFFYYPGFTPNSGGLLREENLAARQAAFDRTAWLQGLGIAKPTGGVVSLFCYEPAPLPALLRQLQQHSAGCTLLVTPGRATAAVRQALNAEPALERGLHIHFLPHLTQHDFDHLLWASDMNFVRGEDSLVRALWAGKPFIWHIYPQDDGVHHTKLDAFLDWMQAPDSLRALHAAWNGSDAQAALPDLQQHQAHWQQSATAARQRLLQIPDLCTQLIDFVQEKR